MKPALLATSEALPRVAPFFTPLRKKCGPSRQRTRQVGPESRVLFTEHEHHRHVWAGWSAAVAPLPGRVGLTVRQAAALYLIALLASWSLGMFCFAGAQ